MGYYRGGPCDGLYIDPSFTEPRVCGGVTYTRGADGNYHPAAISGGAALDTKQVGKAWHRLMRVPAVEAPAAIRRSQAARSRLRRLSR